MDITTRKTFLLNFEERFSLLIGNMKHELRSATCARPTNGRRTCLVARQRHERRTDRRPVIAVVNSFTQFVPGHVHLHEIGQIVKSKIEKFGCFAAEFDTLTDDGIAMDMMVCFIRCLPGI